MLTMFTAKRDLQRFVQYIFVYLWQLYIVESMIPRLVLSDFRGCQDSKRKKNNQADIRKTKFFAEILNATTFKQRKQWNDGVQALQVLARQCISRQEKNRLNLLKIGDQVACLERLYSDKKMLSMLVSQKEVKCQKGQEMRG